MCLGRRSTRLGGRGIPETSQRSHRAVALDPTNPTHPPWMYSDIYDFSTHVWLFPPTLSQSRLGDRASPSSACTLIAVAMARLVLRDNLKFPSMSRRGKWICESVVLPDDSLMLLTNAIVDGNDVHEKKMEERRRNSGMAVLKDMFTIPQALEAVAEGELHEVDFRAVKGYVWKELVECIRAAETHEALLHLPRLCFVMILCERAVLLVLNREEQTVMLLDSHTHSRGRNGALIACTPLSALNKLCLFICCHVFPEVIRRSKSEQTFEISCLQYCGSKKGSAPITAKVFPRPARYSSGRDARAACGGTREYAMEEGVDT